MKKKRTDETSFKISEFTKQYQNDHLHELIDSPISSPNT